LSSAAPPLRDLDSRDALRAIGITAIVANHALVTSVHGGLNVLLVMSGIAFAQLCFGGRDRTGPLVHVSFTLRDPSPMWSVVLCLFWFALFGRFEVAEIFMVSNWITTERVSKFPIWYTQVLLQMLAGIVLLPLLPRMQWCSQTPRFVRRHSGWPPPRSLAVAQALVDTDHLADKLPHLHAWNFVLGWLSGHSFMRDRPGAGIGWSWTSYACR
jgi:hypothetical protein